MGIRTDSRHKGVREEIMKEKIRFTLVRDSTPPDGRKGKVADRVEGGASNVTTTEVGGGVRLQTGQTQDLLLRPGRSPYTHGPFGRRRCDTGV